jgi:predicted RNA-binding protein with PUA-like domain
MAHWLFKSEPSAWSFDKLARFGSAGTDWSGVRNHSAKLNMQAMKVGEQSFFYHSNEGKAIVGIVEVSKAYRPDPTDASGKFGMVDIRAVRPLPHAVTLEEVKNDKRLAGMALATNSRLSVQPVTDAEWAHVLKLGGL